MKIIVTKEYEDIEEFNEDMRATGSYGPAVAALYDIQNELRSRIKYPKKGHRSKAAMSIYEEIYALVNNRIDDSGIDIYQ